MASLADLLRYKDSMDIVHPRTKQVIATVWLRVLGDLDLTAAYRAARIASALKREALRNPESEDYKDEVLGAIDLTTEEQKNLIKTSKLSIIVSEATVAVERPELPKIEEIAVEPDAASLEELEKLDKAELETEKEYQDKLDTYIKERVEVLEAELDLLSKEELLELTRVEIANIVPFSLFITELNAQKVTLGTFNDEACKKRTFETVDDFKQMPKEIQEELISKMSQLEISGPEIKN